MAAQIPPIRKHLLPVLTGEWLFTPPPFCPPAAVISAYDAIVGKCGPVPVQSCFGQGGCFCPHCPNGYQWVVENVMAPAVLQLL